MLWLMKSDASHAARVRMFAREEQFRSFMAVLPVQKARFALDADCVRGPVLSAVLQQLSGRQWHEKSQEMVRLSLDLVDSVFFTRIF